ncbi:MAG: acetyl-CoA carboxylase biotin carboxyl carrier protein subunit, partial [Ilumatobacteraceae bacterium]
GWRNNPAVDQSLAMGHGEAVRTVTYRLGRGGHVSVDGEPLAVEVLCAKPHRVVVKRDGVRHTFGVGRDGAHRHVDAADGHVTFTLLPRHPEPDALLAAGSLVAPMPGVVRRVLVTPGDAVLAGQALVVVEAMKMEHQIQAPADGTVAEVFVAEGDQVDTGQVLLRLEDAT